MRALLLAGALVVIPLQAAAEDWKPWVPAKGIEAGGPLDASACLDPPAGKHGFLTVRGGRFFFEDGTPARFFGVNIQGGEALPTHRRAEELAGRLAWMGCNLVRLHLVDAAWAAPNLFDPAHRDTQHLSAEALDRLDFFISQLRARGIYTYLDLLARRRFSSEDQVADWKELEGGAKGVAQYNRRIIELQKRFARDLLTRINPYTGRSLAAEPALALIDLINESSLFRLPEWAEKIPLVYREELSRLWEGYQRDRGGVLEPPVSCWEGAHPRVQEFYTYLQASYFDELSEYLRGLGLRIPLAGSNLSVEGGDLLTNARLDFVDRHAYWDHPQGGYGARVRFHNRPLLASLEKGNPVVRLSRQQVEGKPFVVSEWSIPWPHEYRAAGPLVMAVYGLFQGWDGLLQFNYQGDFEPARILSNFDASAQPEVLLQIPVAARLFHRRDVRLGKKRLLYPILPEPNIPLPASLVHRVERSVGGESPRGSAGLGRAPWTSDTGEIRWDPEAGWMTVDTPRTKAAIGRLPASGLRLEHVTWKTAGPFAALILSSLDDRPVDESRRLVLIAVARAENSGTVYSADRTQLRDPGRPPILLEPVTGSVRIAHRGRTLEGVFALDSGGQRTASVPVRRKRGMIEIPLAAGHAYEIDFGAER